MTVIDEFEEEFKKFTGSKYAIACCNGTAALHTAVTALGIGKGDKVITTPFSFVSTANCILYNGGIPIFADINPNTYLIDPSEVKKQLNQYPDVKAIIPVHLFGKACDMDSLLKLGVPIIEDCAQALGTRYKRKHVGLFGDFGCFSFYATKNLSTFEGGMIITQKSHYNRLTRMIINHGQSKKYRHEILGYNYRMPQICALIGLTQLKLHQIAIKAELGSYGLEQGYYPQIIYNQPLYKKLGIKGNCPNAEAVAKKVRKIINK